MVMEKGSGSMHEGHLLHSDHGKNLGSGRMDACRTTGPGPPDFLELAPIKQENLTMEECKEGRQDELMSGGNIVTCGNKKNSIKDVETDVNVHSGLTGKADLCPVTVKEEPVEQASSGMFGHIQDSGCKTMKHIGGAVLRSSTRRKVFPLSPVQLHTTVGSSVVESSPKARQCKNSFRSSHTLECVHAEGDVDYSGTDDDEDDDETYVPEKTQKAYTQVPFHIKKKIVALAMEHPKWSFSTIRRQCSMSALSNPSQLQRWKKQVAESQLKSQRN